MKWNIIYLHRAGYWAVKRKIPLFPLIIKFLIRLFFNSAVDPSTKIGKTSTFAYGGIGVVIHKRAIIGENVMIGQNVTIGGRSGKYNVPVIGDNVYIAAGSRILGDITIGNNAIIGANAVVITDVPNNTVFAGIPAKFIKEISPKNILTEEIQ